MPALPAADGVIKIVESGTIVGKTWTNIHHFHYAGTAPSDADLTLAASNIMASWVSDFAGVFPSDISLTGVVLEDLSSGSAAVGGWAGSQPGTDTGVPGAGSVCVLVKHLIARRYRGGHPRTYLPPMKGAEMLTPDQWNSSYVALFQTAFDTHIADIIGFLDWTGSSTKTYVSVSYYSSHALRAVPVVDPILGSVVETTIATQRRRVGR